MNQERINKFFKELLYDQEFTKVTPRVVVEKRQEYSSKMRDGIREQLIRLYYNIGYFDVPTTSYNDYLLSRGFSPISKDFDGKQRKLYNIHHIQPLSCGGENELNNLVPISRKFHSFLHDCIITPQIEKLNFGEKTIVHGLPDFSKLKVSLMENDYFMREYQKYVVDNYGVYPANVTKRHLKAKWYKEKFGRERE